MYKKLSKYALTEEEMQQFLQLKKKARLSEEDKARFGLEHFRQVTYVDYLFDIKQREDKK